MFKKFSFWVVSALLAAIGFMVFIHWTALQTAHQKAAVFQVLAQRQRVLDSMSLSLEKYRRISAGFRKLTPDEIDHAKDRLKVDFKKGSEVLDSLDPGPGEKNNTRLVRDQLNELMSSSERIEPTLFSRDAYVKTEIQDLHDQVLATLSGLKKSNDSRISALDLNTPSLNSRSVVLLLGVGTIILILVLSILFRNYLAYLRPLRKLHSYADEMRKHQSLPEKVPHFPGVFSDIQKTLNQLASHLQTHVKDRHKFIQDIVIDLKAPLSLLQAGRHLLGGSKDLQEDQKQDATESVRRGLALVSGSLDDLDDLININQLETRLDERVVDLSEMISELSRKLLGPDAAKKVRITVPPMPVWVKMDSVRFERMLIQVLSKVLDTLSSGADLMITVAQPAQGNWRGVEIIIQDSERLKGGRAIPSGPEQDLVKHWISEKGLSMALANKIVKAHGGMITVAGVVGTSVSVIIRLPQERMAGSGLISPPLDDSTNSVRGLVTQQKGQINGSGSLVIN